MALTHRGKRGRASIHDKVAGERKPLKQKQLEMEGDGWPERHVARTDAQKKPPAVDTVTLPEERLSETDYYTLNNLERALLHDAVGDLDVQVKAARRKQVDVGQATMASDIQRLRLSTIKVNINEAAATQRIAFGPSLRVEIGNALSLRGRWWKKEIARLEDKKAHETNGAVASLKAIEALAKKFGEQLLLELPEEPRDDDSDGGAE